MMDCIAGMPLLDPHDRLRRQRADVPRIEYGMTDV